MKHFSVVLCCLILSSSLYASSFLYDYSHFFPRVVRRINPYTVDIRSLGMGNTEVAGDLGSNSIFSNPALLALQSNGSIKVGMSLQYDFLKDDWLDAYANANDLDIEAQYKPTFNFTNISAALPIKLNASSIPLSIAFGMGYHKAIDLSEEYYVKEVGVYEDMYDSTVKHIDERTSKTSGGLNTVSPGVSIELFNRISAGFSINFGFSRIKISEKWNSQELTFIAVGSSIYPTFGFSGKPLESLCIGLAITPPVSWKISNAEVVEREYKMGGGTFTMPLKLSAGIEYKVNSLFTLAVEYQTRLYESFEFDAEQTTDLLIITDYDIESSDLKNGHVLHIGTELMAGNVPLRTGFFLEPIAQTGKNGRPNYMLGGTFGGSIPVFKLVLIDIAAQYHTVKNTRYRQAEAGTAIIKKYDSEIRSIRIDVGVKINLPKMNTTSTNGVAVLTIKH